MPSTTGVTARRSSVSQADNHQETIISASWSRNAALWTAAVRGGGIPSRRAGTDAAVVAAVGRLRPRAVLDLGCGEGWLGRRLRQELGCAVVGVDGSAGLIELARAADPDGDYRALDYAALAAQPAAAGGPFDLVVANFALLAEELAGLLRALHRLAPGGALVVQTVHPWAARGGGPYIDGWREESFAAFGGGGWQAMPWFYRTLASWHRVLAEGGWRVETLEEPVAGGEPLSLLLTCRPA